LRRLKTAPPRAVIGSLALVAVALLALPGIALAHEQRDVAGYHFVVGFVNEPSLEGQMNGLDLHLSKDGKPVEGAEQTLKVEIIQPSTGAKQALALRPVADEPGVDPGHYTADLIATAPGTYAFHFTGTLDGTAIDATFTSGPNTFGDVESPASLEFPTAVPQPRELAAGLRGANEAATSAQDAAANARSLAVAGVVLGVLGVATGAGGIVVATRGR